MKQGDYLVARWYAEKIARLERDKEKMMFLLKVTKPMVVPFKKNRLPSWRKARWN